MFAGYGFPGFRVPQLGLNETIKKPKPQKLGPKPRVVVQSKKVLQDHGFEFVVVLSRAVRLLVENQIHASKCLLKSRVASLGFRGLALHRVQSKHVASKI